LKHTIFHLLSLILLSCAAHGQQADGRACRILFSERPSGAPATMHLFDRSASREVDLPGMNFSRVYKLLSGKLFLTLLSAPLADLTETTASSGRSVLLRSMIPLVVAESSAKALAHRASISAGMRKLDVIFI
jgi:hypothetical protein